MHDAKCTLCGKDTKVPFKPTMGKPIRCSECLESVKQGDADEEKLAAERKLLISLRKEAEANAPLRLFVGRLSREATEADIKKAFGEHGEVVDFHMPVDRDTGNPRGFAFVTLSPKSAGEAAIKALNGAELAGRKIVVEASQREGRGPPSKAAMTAKHQARTPSREHMAGAWLVLDGYEDEPAAFGVPNYIGFHARYICGVFEERGIDYRYSTIDDLRLRRRASHHTGDDSLMPDAEDVEGVVILAGAVVPGKYVRGTPISRKEVDSILPSIPSGCPILIGGWAVRIWRQEGWTPLRRTSSFPCRIPMLL